jgi:hypothetical protein
MPNDRREYVRHVSKTEKALARHFNPVLPEFVDLGNDDEDMDFEMRPDRAYAHLDL